MEISRFYTVYTAVYENSGVFGFILMIMFGVAFGLFLERFTFLTLFRRHILSPDVETRRFIDAFVRGKADAAKHLRDKNAVEFYIKRLKPLAAESGYGLTSGSINEETMRGVFKDILSDLFGYGFDLRIGCSLFSAFSMFAPSIAFMGTLWGLIPALANLADAAENLRDFGQNLSTAMTTSLLGAVMGVVFYLFYWLIDAKVSRIERHFMQIGSDYRFALLEYAKKD